MSDPVRKAAARLGGLSSYGRVPDPSEEAAAGRTLATARIDREIRQSLAKYGPVEPAQAAHLIGLILGESGVKYDAASGIESLARAAVKTAQSGDAE